MKARLSIYNCTHVSTGDGDTFRCGGDVRPVVPDSKEWVPNVRIPHVDAPEGGEPGYEDARVLLDEWLTRGPFNLISYGRDKYGRLLADAERGEGLLSDYLLANGVPRIAEGKLRALLVE